MLKLYVKTQCMIQNLKDECGQDSVEYAIMIGIVALAAIASVSTISSYVSAQCCHYAVTL